jgi:hypothetical protein
MFRCAQHDSFGHWGHNGVPAPSDAQDDSRGDMGRGGGAWDEMRGMSDAGS